MRNLLTMNELSISEMEEILEDAEHFANGASWKPEEQTMVANYFLNQVHVQNQALKWRREN